MSDPIRDRRPTKADGDSKWGDVLVYRDGCWSSCFHGNVKEGESRKPIDQTPPPKPEKPKRRELCIDTIEGETIHYTEVLPGDPPDLDALLEWVDKFIPFIENGGQFSAAGGWVSLLKAARHGEAVFNEDDLPVEWKMYLKALKDGEGGEA